MSKQKKLPGRRMTLIDTCWRRNLSVWVLVCMCWFGSVAGQKALEQVEDESNEAASEEATTSLTNDTASLGMEPLETLELEQPDKTSGILNLGCTGIRFRRYVSNGFCTSRRPLRDMICDGDCLPMDQLPFFPNFSKIISRHKREWRCVADDRRTKKVKLICNDGTMRKYRVSVVRSCKCKRYTRKQNQTRPNSEK
ncbi:sclerostin domain-containing protein 1-like [Acropora muricata]|uniref:sclerostin domain-containing protein 1-like n=1 Tax=Acropora muricata TaxID=159855 RepID=UPI0010FC9327